MPLFPQKNTMSADEQKMMLEEQAAQQLLADANKSDSEDAAVSAGLGPLLGALVGGAIGLLGGPGGAITGATIGASLGGAVGSAGATMIAPEGEGSKYAPGILSGLTGAAGTADAKGLFDKNPKVPVKTGK